MVWDGKRDLQLHFPVLERAQRVGVFLEAGIQRDRLHGLHGRYEPALNEMLVALLGLFVPVL